MEKTFPCIIGNRIVELTAEQRAAAEWRLMTAEEKVDALLDRVEALELALQKIKNADTY